MKELNELEEDAEKKIEAYEHLRKGNLGKSAESILESEQKKLQNTAKKAGDAPKQIIDGLKNTGEEAGKTLNKLLAR